MKTVKIKNQKELDAFFETGEKAHIDIREWDDEGISMDYRKVYGNFLAQGIEFTGLARFTSTVFFEMVNFNDVSFLEAVDFGWSIFHKEVDLKGSRYREYSSFEDMIFYGDVDFRKTVFRKSVDFDRTTFKGDVDFRESIFEGRVQLVEVELDSLLKLSLNRRDISFLKRIPSENLEMANWHADDKWLHCRNINEVKRCGTTYCIRGWAEIEYYLKNKEECENVDTLIPNLKLLFYMNDEQAKRHIKHYIEEDSKKS